MRIFFAKKKAKGVETRQKIKKYEAFRFIPIDKGDPLPNDDWRQVAWKMADSIVHSSLMFNVPILLKSIFYFSSKFKLFIY